MKYLPKELQYVRQDECGVFHAVVHDYFFPKKAKMSVQPELI